MEKRRTGCGSSIAIDPQDSRTIYVGGFYVKLQSVTPFVRPAYEIYKTTDGGETWSELSSGLPDCCSFGD